MSIELLPCPFCGGEMRLAHDHTIEDVDTIRHAVQRPGCPIDGASGFSIGNDNLVAAWNTRLSTSPVAGDGSGVERAAVAIWQTWQGREGLEADGITWEMLPPYARDLYRACAKAALSTTPTPEASTGDGR